MDPAMLSQLPPTGVSSGVIPRAWPQHQLGCLVAGGIFPHQQQTQRRQILQRGEAHRRAHLPDLPGGARGGIWHGSQRLQLRQDLAQTLIQPRMQHRIYASIGFHQPHLAGGGTEQGQDLGRAATDVLMRPRRRAAGRTAPDAAPPRTGRPRLVLALDRQPKLGAQREGLIDQLFGRRIGIADAHQPTLAVPQRHADLAPGAALLPAQTRFVQSARWWNRLTRGKPSGARRRAFCSRLND